MAIKELKDTTTELPDELKDVFKGELEYQKLYFFRMFAKMGVGITNLFIFGMMLFCLFFFLSIGASLAIGQALGAYYLGFLITAAITLLFIIILYTFKETLIYKFLLKKISEIFYPNEK